MHAFLLITFISNFVATLLSFRSTTFIFQVLSYSVLLRLHSRSSDLCSFRFFVCCCFIQMPSHFLICTVHGFLLFVRALIHWTVSDRLLCWIHLSHRFLRPIGYEPCVLASPDVTEPPLLDPQLSPLLLDRSETLSSLLGASLRVFRPFQSLEPRQSPYWCFCHHQNRLPPP